MFDTQFYVVFGESCCGSSLRRFAYQSCFTGGLSDSGHGQGRERKWAACRRADIHIVAVFLQTVNFAENSGNVCQRLFLGKC